MKKVTSIQQTIIKGGGGEPSSSITSRTFIADSEPSYVKMYLDTVLYLSDLPKGYNPILRELLRSLTYVNSDGTGHVILVNKFLKKSIKERLNTSITRIEHALTDLVKGKVLFRVARGTYRMNPHLFGKGEWKDIHKIRMTIDFDANGRTVLSEIERGGK